MPKRQCTLSSYISRWFPYVTLCEISSTVKACFADLFLNVEVFYCPTKLYVACRRPGRFGTWGSTNSTSNIKHFSVRSIMLRYMCRFIWHEHSKKAHEMCVCVCAILLGRYCGNCLTIRSETTCEYLDIQECVCEVDGYCCRTSWDDLCTSRVQNECGFVCYDICTLTNEVCQWFMSVLNPRNFVRETVFLLFLVT